MLLKKKKQILENWIKMQMEDPSLREDLISNEDIQIQSDELLTALLKAIDSENTIEGKSYDTVKDILAGISISRAKQGFSPKETGIYVLSL
jgi:rsbT co-antagonist protein RsbR